MKGITKEEVKALWRVQRIIYKNCDCFPGSPECDFCSNFPDLSEAHGLILDLYGKLHDAMYTPESAPHSPGGHNARNLESNSI